MKRKVLSLLLALTVVIGALSACGKKEASDNTTPVQEDDDNRNDNKDDTGDDENKPTTEELYAAFLSGEKVAVAGADINGLTEGTEYSINNMASALNISAEWYVVINMVSKIQYGLIDAGSDGEPELAVKFVFSDEDNTDYAEIMIILKNYDGVIKALWRTDTYYRTASSILINGIVTYGGSNSAFEHTTEYRVIDKDGNINYICGIDSVYGLSKCIIPAGYMSGLITGSDYPTVPDLCADPGDVYYIMQMIKTAPYDYSHYSDEDFYEYGKQHLYYIFSDNEGEIFFDADPDYADYYKNKEVHVVSVDEAPTFLESIFAEFGLDNNSTMAPEVTWKDLEQ